MRRYLYLTFLLAGVAGCKELTGSTALPAGTPNPDSYNTRSGAVGMRNAAIFAFEQALPIYAIETGELTDELEDYQTGASQGILIQNGGTIGNPLDERLLASDVTVNAYSRLQGVRTVVLQALGALAAYDTTAADSISSRIYRSELYSVHGYADLMLAEFFCSGVPLSTLTFQGDFVYAPSSTRAQVEQAAVAQFDTALRLAGDSVRLQNIARVGLGRAYLDANSPTVAADDVAIVPDTFQYQLVVPWASPNASSGGYDLLNDVATVSDTEGLRGLPFISSGDPRSAVDTVAQQLNGTVLAVPLTFPKKYASAVPNGYAPFVIASGIEARLIEAEAALTAGNTTLWLQKLNTLRSSGVGGYTGLGTLADPGAALHGTAADSARVKLLFDERAYWLFVTGHRQEDLRRLLRQYPTIFTEQSKVYPTGRYNAPGQGLYGSDVTAPIPVSESANPDFHGCIDRNP